MGRGRRRTDGTRREKRLTNLQTALICALCASAFIVLVVGSWFAWQRDQAIHREARRVRLEWEPFEKRWAAEIEGLSPRGSEPRFYHPPIADDEDLPRLRPPLLRPELAAPGQPITGKAHVLYDFAECDPDGPKLRRPAASGESGELHPLNDDWLPGRCRPGHPPEVGFVVLERWKSEGGGGAPRVYRFCAEVLVYDVARKVVVAQRWFDGPRADVPARSRGKYVHTYAGDWPVKEAEAWVLGLIRQ